MTSSPTPVTPERIAALLSDEGIPHELLGDTVIVTFAEYGVYFGVFPEAIGAAGNWAGAVDPALVPVALGACNEWNLTQLNPMLTFTITSPSAESDHAPTGDVTAEPRPGDMVSFSFRRTGIIGAQGWTHNQLGAWIMTTLENIQRLVVFLEGQFPDTTTTITGDTYVMPTPDADTSSAPQPATDEE
ncbi:hypothetical protein C1Y63_03605 [Corynebacterium sp. 13CS0277]|uniref:hypothetical protein n=1 Tax=Corynebacterium sp. 13CS0277 TaxID=2071994 RepID=UPI000D029EBC|nr:hypothetical protein [Corynebacterium sp. 13CS0277]PRQ11950.1 hypothetical protein C1Y63_03605 [Corynebacterium sp. 13CS0277]